MSGALDRWIDRTIAEARAQGRAEGYAQACEDAAREADRGYLASESCDDIAARIRALRAKRTDGSIET